AAKKVKGQVADVTEEILDVVAKDPQEEHIAKKVCNSRMEKHTSEKREDGGLQMSVPGKEVAEPGRHCAVDRCQHRLGTMRERKFVEEYGEIGENDSVVDEGNCAGWIFVLKGNEHDLERGLWQGNEKGGGCKQIYESDNFDSAKVVVNGI